MIRRKIRPRFAKFGEDRSFMQITFLSLIKRNRQ